MTKYEINGLKPVEYAIAIVVFVVLLIVYSAFFQLGLDYLPPGAFQYIMNNFGIITSIIITAYLLLFFILLYRVKKIQTFLLIGPEGLVKQTWKEEKMIAEEKFNKDIINYVDVEVETLSSHRGPTIAYYFLKVYTDKMNKLSIPIESLPLVLKDLQQLGYPFHREMTVILQELGVVQKKIINEVKESSFILKIVIAGLVFLVVFSVILAYVLRNYWS